MSDKDNGTPGTLRNFGKAAEDRAHFVSLVHVGFVAHVRLYGVKDNQPRPVLYDCFLYALVGQSKLPLGFINHKYAVKVGFGFHKAGLDGIAQTVLGSLVNHLEWRQGLHSRQRSPGGAGGGKA